MPGRSPGKQGRPGARARGCAFAAALLAAVLSVAAVVGIAVGLWVASGAAKGERVDPSQKARVLAEGLSEGINWAALAFVLSLPVGVAVAARRWRAWKRRTSDSGGGDDGEGRAPR